MIFKAAILQMRSRNRDIKSNIATVIGKMEEAGRNGADILLLPECFVTGYDLTIVNSEALTEAELLPIREKAREWSIGVIATAIMKGQRKPQNAAFVIDKNGEILMQYAKVHTQGNQFWFKTLRMVNESRRQSNMILEIAFLD